MNYKDIMKSDFFKNTYKKIEDLKKDFPVNHGFIHIENVLENAKNLAETFSLSKKEKENLYIACALHDVGYLCGREEHPKNGMIISKKFLSENHFPQKDINIICNAIAQHSGKELSDFKTPVSRCLILADKLDFISSRYNPNAKDQEKVKNFLSIKSVKLNVGSQIIVKIFVKEGFCVEEFETVYFERKLKSILEKLSETLKKSFKIEYIKTKKQVL